MCSISDDEYYDRHLFLKQSWDGDRVLFTLVPTNAEWAVHEYYQPSKEATREELLEHRQRVGADRPELLAAADAAFQFMHEAYHRQSLVPHPDASSVSTIPKGRGRKERRVRIRSVARPEPDLKKLASALIELAQQQAQTEEKPRPLSGDDSLRG